uniref:THAP-type domain-containing protein n=1 Tax=Kryptolebias marmoratus TaxID=37003 RepID=A0A3Q3F104_KRYMA
MPNYCVVGDCNNVANRSLGISTYAFPKDDAIRRAWIRFVQQTRADFREPGSGAVVCSSHFKEDCFEIPCPSVRKLGSSVTPRESSEPQIISKYNSTKGCCSL